MCTSVTANTDDLVEPEEYFMIELALVTPAGSSLRLGNTESAVTITDSDGNCEIIHSGRHDAFPFCVFSGRVCNTYRHNYYRKYSNVHSVLYYAYKSPISNSCHGSGVDSVNLGWHR